MSIITLLRRKDKNGKKDVYLKFKDTFLKPKLPNKPILLAPALTKKWSITGHAFDNILEQGKEHHAFTEPLQKLLKMQKNNMVFF